MQHDFVLTLKCHHTEIHESYQDTDVNDSLGPDPLHQMCVTNPFKQLFLLSHHLWVKVHSFRSDYQSSWWFLNWKRHIVQPQNYLWRSLKLFSLSVFQHSKLYHIFWKIPKSFLSIMHSISNRLIWFSLIYHIIGWYIANVGLNNGYSLWFVNWE